MKIYLDDCCDNRTNDDMIQFSVDFDYTKWQKEHYDQMTPEEIFKELNDYSKTHTFEGKKAVII